MRQSKPGLGEITSVIIVIAVFAIATPILVYNYYDRADISGGIIRERARPAEAQGRGADSDKQHRM